MIININAVKTFFNPHPGLAGASIPIPDAVKKVADELNNKSMPLCKAMEKIQAVTDGKVLIGNKIIILKIRELDTAVNVFRVISFR